MLPITDELKSNILEKVDNYSSKAMRVLALAYSNLTDLSLSPERMEEQLVFVGLTAIMDPPREEVAPAIIKARHAGIDVRMITGDYIKTAEAVAKQIGLIDHDSTHSCVDCRIIRSYQLGDPELKKIIMQARVFARARPEDKIIIISVLQDAGFICSMTGDGVNDSPALKKADIGVAMGITGTDAAKAAAHMVLMDDSFSTIILAVEEGRRIYTNIGKFVYFLLSTNISEVLTILVTSFMGLQAPLVPVQILWLNLMTDSLPALAMCNEAIESFVMVSPPRPKDSHIVSKIMLTSIAIHTMLLTTGMVYSYVWALEHYTGAHMGAVQIADDDLVAREEYEFQMRQAQTVVMLTIICAELLRGFTSRSLIQSVFTIGVFTNVWMLRSVTVCIGITVFVSIVPGVKGIFGMEYLDSDGYGWVILFSFLPSILDEFLKLIYRRTGFGITVSKDNQVAPTGNLRIDIDSLLNQRAAERAALSKDVASSPE